MAEYTVKSKTIGDNREHCIVTQTRGQALRYVAAFEARGDIWHETKVVFGGKEFPAGGSLRQELP